MSEMDSTRAEGSRSLPPPPAPVGAAAFSPRRLYRDPHSWLGGVASGFAAYFEIDPVIVRLLWIVALLGGIGFPAYLVCWAVIPKAKVWPPPGYAERAPSDPRTATLASGLVIVALAALIGKGVDGMGDLLLPAALIGFGVYLLNQRNLHSNGPDARDPAPHAPRGAAATDAYFVDAGGTLGGAEEGSSAPGPSGLVTPTVLSLLAIGTGVAWALHAAGLMQVSVSSVAAGGLVLVGAGLLASLWLGRAPWLSFVGLALSGVLLVASAVEPWLAHDHWFQASNWPPLVLDRVKAGAGERHFEPRTLAELEPAYELGLGDLTLDLRQLDFSGSTRQVRVKLGLGDLKVLLPTGPSVQVHGDVGLGEATALGRHEEGASLRIDSSDPGQQQGSLELDFNLGMGKGTVRREQ